MPFIAKNKAALFLWGLKEAEFQLCIEKIFFFIYLRKETLSAQIHTTTVENGKINLFYLI